LFDRKPTVDFGGLEWLFAENSFKTVRKNEFINVVKLRLLYYYSVS